MEFELLSHSIPAIEMIESNLYFPVTNESPLKSTKRRKRRISNPPTHSTNDMGEFCDFYIFLELL